jgi:hypothetical protein
METRKIYAAVLWILAAAEPAAAHDMYEGLTARNGQPCCNERDCRPVGHRYTAESGHEVEIEGQWVSVAPGIILPTASPDGRNHACYYPVWSTYQSTTTVTYVLRCVILGGQS